MGLLDKIRAWRYGYTGITGLNQMRHNFEMLIIIIVPFLVAWYGAQYIVYMELIPTWAAPWLLVTVFVGWGAYCGLYYATVKIDASNYKGLPQATCYFPDGGVVKFDFLIKPDGITERCRWKNDNSVGIEVEFVNRYLYQARDMDFPYVFEKALMRIPAETGEAFKFLATGEFWHKGMAVETPNCEHISFYVYGWVKENGEWKPVGAINDCSLNYSKALQKYSGNPSNELAVHEADINWMLYKAALQREDEVRQYSATIEASLETALEQSGKTVKKQVDHVVSSVRERVHLITDTSEPMWKRIFNFGFLVKAIVIIVVVLILARFVFQVI